MLAIQASPAIPHGTTCSSAQNAGCQICYWSSLLMSRWGNALQYSEGGGGGGRGGGVGGGGGGGGGGGRQRDLIVASSICFS